MSRRDTVLTMVLSFLLAAVSPLAFGSSFQAAGHYTVGDHPLAIAAGDFNGDGKIDLAVAKRDKTIGVLLGNGDGTFGEAAKYSAAQAPREAVIRLRTQAMRVSGKEASAVVFADFNGDGRMDQAVIISGKNEVSVLLRGEPSSTPSPNNLIENPSFESGRLSPWYQGADYCSGTCVNWQIGGLDPFTGHFDAGDVGNIELRQDFAATAVSSIAHIELWIRHPAGDQPAAINLYYSDATYGEFVVYTSDENWDLFDVTSDLAPGETLNGFSIFGFEASDVSEPFTYVDGVGVMIGD